MNRVSNSEDDHKRASRGISADMSAEAIWKRLLICSDLSRACRELGTAIQVETSDVTAIDCSEAEIAQAPDETSKGSGLFV